MVCNDYGAFPGDFSEQVGFAMLLNVFSMVLSHYMTDPCN